MKILPVFNNFIRQKVIIQNNQYDYSEQRLSLFKNPISDTFEKNISFNGSPESVNPSRAPLEKIYKHNLTCLCCGRVMIEPKKIAELEKSGVLKLNSAEAVKYLEKYRNNMHSVEQQVFDILKEQSKLYPYLNFQQILNIIKPEYEKPLIKTQFGIFKMIEKACDNIDPKLKQNVANLIQEEKSLILSGNNHFRRKRFVRKFEQIFEGTSNTALKEHLIRLANKLPTSYEDKNAFVVKYSSYPSEAIGIRLLSYSICTIEHVLPKNRDGENHIFNYIPECMRCNSFRQDRKMTQQLEEHPEMFANAQILMDRLIDFANKGKLSKLYIVRIKQRIEEESEGLLDLDISKLDIPEKAKNKIPGLNTDTDNSNSRKTKSKEDGSADKKTKKQLKRERLKERHKRKYFAQKENKKIR